MLPYRKWSGATAWKDRPLAIVIGSEKMTVTAVFRGTLVVPAGGEKKPTLGGVPSRTMSPTSSGLLDDVSVNVRMAKPGIASLRISSRLPWNGTPSKENRPSAPVTTVRPTLLVTRVTSDPDAGWSEAGGG